ncbi:MAG: shikimate kinase [Balneolales bacterium]
MQIQQPPANPVHILLCGFMAAGKSSIGRMLARNLGKPFHDLDRTIEQEEEKFIVDIFAGGGEEHFRALELRYLDHLLGSGDSVIALGGGTLQNEGVLNTLKKEHILVYLNTPFPLIFKRLIGNKTRPMLFKKDGTKRDIKELKAYLYDLHKKREKLYVQAQICINIEPFWNRFAIVEKIEQRVREHGCSS